MVCSLLASFGNAQEYTTNNLIIKQGNKTYTINEAEQTITLRPEEFSIEYLNKAYQEKFNTLLKPINWQPFLTDL